MQAVYLSSLSCLYYSMVEVGCFGLSCCGTQPAFSLGCDFPKWDALYLGEVVLRVLAHFLKVPVLPMELTSPGFSGLLLLESLPDSHRGVLVLLTAP